MQFHVTIKVHDAIVLEGDKLLRQTLGPQLQHVMESDKIQASGILAGRRGGFFIVDIDAPEELVELFGSEIYGNCEIDAQPVASIEKAGEIFQKWAEEGR